MWRGFIVIGSNVSAALPSLFYPQHSFHQRCGRWWSWERKVVGWQVFMREKVPLFFYALLYYYTSALYHLRCISPTPIPLVRNCNHIPIFFVLRSSSSGTLAGYLDSSSHRWVLLVPQCLWVFDTAGRYCIVICPCMELELEYAQLSENSSLFGPYYVKLPKSKKSRVYIRKYHMVRKPVNKKHHDIQTHSDFVTYPYKF